MGVNRSSASEYKQEFWSEIEDDIGDEIPVIIKTMLSKCGYEHRFCLETLTTADVDDIEKHIRNLSKEKLKRWLKLDSDYEHTVPSEFIFLPGHRKLITLIPKKLSKVNGETTTANKELAADRLKSDSRNPTADKITISEDKLTAIEEELCQSILQWMSRKDFSEIVSTSAMYC